MERASKAISAVLLPAACWLACASAEGARPLTADKAQELKTLTGQLADPTRSPKTQLEAAGLLLTRPYPQAAEALRKFLADATNRPAQIAVAQAIAAQGGGSPAFIDPLMAMLTGEEASVRQPAAMALVTYKNRGVAAKLIALATDVKGEKAVRLVAISALQRVLNQQAVDALVGLVGSRDATIRAAAADALTKLTNIRAFGSDPQKWRQWWARNQNKPASEWLADLADSLAREKARLEEQNAALRKRLAAAMTDLYTATPAAQQGRLLLDFLKDPLADVRLAGVKLTDRKLAGNGPVPDELKAQVRAMLADPDALVRAAVPPVLAGFGDQDAVKLLLVRLKSEEVSEVKQGLLAALGQFRDANALAPVLAEVDSTDEQVAAAAAGAVARLAAKQPPQGPLRARMVQALLARHRRIAAATNGSAALREALLTAMGMVADKQFLPVLRAGVKEPAATVRLAAVRALARLRQPELADVVAPLAADADRGVRQAVIDALGALNGPKHLQTILQRVDPGAEPDAAVRERAWTVAQPILAKADAATLSQVAESLADRKELLGPWIKVMQLLAQALKADKSPKLPDVQRKLATALVAESRPAEAAPLLGEAYKLYAAAKNPLAPAVYLEWIDALLGGNDPAVVKAMAEQADAASFAAGLERLNRRLADLSDKGKYAPAILLAGEALRQLPARLAAAEKKALTDLAADARTKQTVADRKRISQLVAQLLAAEAASRDAAVAELKNLGDRAVEPLVVELKRAASAPAPNPEAEQAILSVLTQIAPKLTGYDPKAAQAERIKCLDGWLKALSAGSSAS